MTPLDLTMLIFVFMLGACVGSFLNVVIYRLPAGESLVRPASHCPHCDYRLAWYDNVPIVGWVWLRGRCRKCGAAISIQYPLIELFTALLFIGLYWVLYLSDLRPDFALIGFTLSWPVYVAYAILIAGLLAATIIDARYYIIPLQIPWFITAAAIVLPPMAWLIEQATVKNPALVRDARLLLGAAMFHSQPWVTGEWATAAMCGMLGLAAAITLMHADILPRSFTEFVYDRNPLIDETDVFLPHPHPRREMLKELAFLAFPAAGCVIGYYLGNPKWIGGHDWLSPVLHVLGGVMLGYLAGGAVVWGTRLLGTLAFGKEAMGLGDVHLMAAVGAVAGWRTAVLAFFIAPFLGLAWALASAGAQKLLKREVRMIPYGPHLAVASVVVIIFHESLMSRFAPLLGG